jgi:hypothetical protein
VRNFGQEEIDGRLMILLTYPLLSYLLISHIAQLATITTPTNIDQQYSP